MLGILGIKLLQIILNIIFDHDDILSIITLIRLYIWNISVSDIPFTKFVVAKRGKVKKKVT